MGCIPRWFARHHGGELVPEGAYWNSASLKFIQIRGTVDFLPGKRESLYVRVPTLLVPFAALLLGLVYVIALSLAPIVFVGWLGMRGGAAVFGQFRAWRSIVGWSYRGL